MISFKLFFESTTAGVIVPADIYSFYYINNYKNNLLGSEHNQEIILKFLNNLRLKYLNTWPVVLKTQLEKYLNYQRSGRKRIKSDAELLKINIENFFKNPVIDYDKLEQYIKETTRSSGEENKLWNYFAEWLNKLSKKQSITIGSLNLEGQENILFIIDRINNCVHNTKESMFEKIRENGFALKNAFDDVNSMRDARYLKSKSIPEIKELEELEVSSSLDQPQSTKNIDNLERQMGRSPSFYKHSGD